jgi:hypothetical protein
MAKSYAENVVETSNTIGNTTYELAGAVLGHRSFAAAGFVTGDKPDYVVRNVLNTKYEFNRGGTFTNSAVDTLTRATYLSSNSNLPVVWTAQDLPLTVFIPTISLDTVGNLLLKSSTGILGYGVGAGGQVTQLTSKSTAVVLDRPSGQITMHNASLAAGAKVVFSLSNTCLQGSTNGCVVWVDSGGTNGAYRASVVNIFSNSISIMVENTTGGALAEAPVIGFALIAIQLS